MKELLKKIQKVSIDCKAIEKDMEVGKGNNSYKAVSDHSVVLKVKEAERKAGIISIPIKQELVSSEVVRFQKKEYNSSEQIEKINYVDVVKLTLRIYDIEAENETFIDVESYGRGLDAGDKGFGKASTYARKYALLNAYKIATGEDPDAEPSSKEISIITPKEKTIKVLNYLEQDNKYRNNILQHFGVESEHDLTDRQILTLYDTITKKKSI